jgi:PAS domain S-box-containing protein
MGVWPQNRIVQCANFDDDAGLIHPESIRDGGEGVLDSTEQFRRLVERSPDGVIVSRDGRVVYANQAAARLVGAASPGQVVGTLLLDLCAQSCRDRIHASLDQLRAGDAVAIEGSIHRLDGDVTDVSANATVIEDGQLVLTMRDVTGRSIAEAALRESEERLRLAFAGAQEGVWDWNLETGAVVYSPRWKQMLGYDEEEIEPHVREWERLLHPDDMASARALSDSVQQGAPTYEGEFRLRHKDGSYIHVLSRGFPVRREPGGPVVRIVGTHFDLTERRRREAEQARSELLGRLVFAQEDERRRIAREMHDQFGEQLTSLSREIAMLKEACQSDPVASAHVRSLESISQQLDRDVDHLVWQLRPTALDDLGLRAALANYVQDWSARVGIPAELHMSGLLDERLPPDAETTLYRIAQEALTNVARHSRATRADVMLERQGAFALLTVEDDGVGFEPEEMKSAGGGFGLLGMHERSALVGATLQIESAKGEGTTVLLRLPLGPLTAPGQDHA